MPSLSARADVAQLVEQRFRKPQVAGSIPAVGSPQLRIDAIDGRAFCQSVLCS